MEQWTEHVSAESSCEPSPDATELAYSQERGENRGGGRLLRGGGVLPTPARGGAARLSGTPRWEQRRHAPLASRLPEGTQPRTVGRPHPSIRAVPADSPIRPRDDGQGGDPGRRVHPRLHGLRAT